MDALTATQLKQQDKDEIDLAQHAVSDAEAFAELYRRHLTRVYRYHIAHVGNTKVAEDLTSQTFMAALEGIRSFRGNGSFAASIMGIASRKRLMFFRAGKPEVPVDELMRLNNLTDASIYVGQSFVVPIPEPTEQPVTDLSGTLAISIANRSDGTSTKEYRLKVPQDNGVTMYLMEGSILCELDPYNQMPIQVTGTINTEYKLISASYKIPYPDLHFQILKGTQSTAQINGQSVIVFTTEEGTRHVEFLLNNNIPNTVSITGVQGDLIQQEVLIIPDETFGGFPVARIYQSAIVQEGAPDMQVPANQIFSYNEPDDPRMSPDYTPPNLTIDHVELVYYVSNPYYQVDDPNYNQRSPYIEPAWHFRGRYEDGTAFDVLIQALQREFLLPELAPKAGMG